MTDDIVTRLRKTYKDADEVAAVFLTQEAANYIDNLINQLRIQAEVVNGKDYHTISGGLHLDAADQIERLRNWASYEHAGYCSCAGGNDECVEKSYEIWKSMQ